MYRYRQELNQDRLHFPVDSKDHSLIIYFVCWQDAQGLLEESRSLEKKVYLASEAQRAAKDVEQDYAEVSRKYPLQAVIVFTFYMKLICQKVY